MKTIFAAIALLFVSALSAQSYKGDSRTPTLQEKLNEQYCSGLFKTTDGVILDIASDVTTSGYINILDWLQGRVAGVQILTTRTGVKIPIIRGSVPGIYIDEIPVSSSTVNMFNVKDIAIIKIIKTPFYGGFNGGGGAIAVYTLRGEDEED